ncbi:response regulator receiver domain-containing protein [Sulfuritortus calidifontis]|uniref:Response regulator receiver domain-containing protein n=1 Tax=Sulfuritortus calidifontis TaxID=1914471 RepID=A0A4R3JUK0_9PROT|nr:response regulator [Sulfuritortus calidifontis]TCS71497.1 response regulator receiver domain-containing protein [Sulfuritortus calidifontis]
MPYKESDFRVNSQKVVVVEDDEVIAYLLEFILKREGYEAVRAKDGREAIDLIQTMAAPSLVLLDVMLPYSDGFQLIHAIRGNSQWQSVPIVMLTVKSQEQDIVRALDSGADDYILKPFQPNELLARIRRFLKVKT